MARNQQKQGVGQHLVAGVRPHDFTLADYRQQVVAGIAYPLSDDGSEVIGNRLHAGGVIADAVGVVAVEAAHLPAQFLDESAIGGRYVHQAGDDAVGQRRGEVVHHVHAAGALQIVQQVVHRLPHQRTPGFHGLGGEVAVHHLALFLVLRPVVLGETGGHPLAHRCEQLHILFGYGWGGRVVVAQGYLGGKVLGVSGGPNEAFVTGHHPHLVLLVPVYRRF